MCRQFGQTGADERENTRILLKIYEERNNHLATIIHASNGLIIAILVGVLTFAGSIKNGRGEPFYIALITGIIILSMIVWRANAHWVDNEIIGVYGKILCCEYKLNVDPRTSLLMSLVAGLPDKSKKKEELLNLTRSNQITKAYKEIFFLIEEKKVGDRGHFRIDCIASIVCILAIVFVL